MLETSTLLKPTPTYHSTSLTVSQTEDYKKQKRKCVIVNIFLIVTIVIIISLGIAYNPLSNSTHKQLYSESDNEIHKTITYINNDEMIDKLTYYFNQFLNDKECIDTWPNVKPCYVWLDDNINNVKYVLTNNIPSKDIAPEDYTYCPFEIGSGYCFTDGNGNIELGSTSCSQFFGYTCPASDSPSTGDVPKSRFKLYGIPMYPSPIIESPKDLFTHYLLKWEYTKELNVNEKQEYYKFKNKLVINPDGNKDIGITANGLMIMGPSEAEGYIVDVVGIEFVCGGHINPGILNLGSLWHFHKATTCLNGNTIYDTMNSDSNNNKIIDENILSILKHSNLIGYGADGFGIYGTFDINGDTPILDECNGHFGPIGYDFENNKQIIEYHYHQNDYTYNTNDNHFEPYFLGCQGPAISKCDSTVNNNIDNGNNYCGSGCNSDLCIQYGTDLDALKSYINKFGGESWFNKFSNNLFNNIN